MYTAIQPAKINKTISETQLKRFYNEQDVNEKRQHRQIKLNCETVNRLSACDMNGNTFSKRISGVRGITYRIGGNLFHAVLFIHNSSQTAR